MSGACAVAADERLAAYDFGPDHPFQAGRLDAGLSLLRAAKVLDDDDLLAFDPAADADLELIHDRDYLEALARFSAAGPAPADPVEATRFGLVGDNRPFPGMDQAARLVAGATMAAVDAVAAGDLAHVFAPVAGLHHAQRRRAVGFCLVNDVAVAIARCTRAWPLRVLYVDLDAHHGDGVQAAFYDDPRVCTVSLHETGRYLFPGSGEVHELGRPPGTGRSVNVPLEPRTGDDGFLAAFDAVVEPLAAAFRPDLLVTQNGCDGHADDPLSDLTLSLRGFRELARRLHRLAHRHCQGRWVATGGGGYDLDRVVPRAWALLWSELSGRRLPARVPSAWLASRPEPAKEPRSTGHPLGVPGPLRRLAGAAAAAAGAPGPGRGSWRSATSGRSGRCGGWSCRRRCGSSTRWPGGPGGPRPGGCRAGSRGRASTSPRRAAGAARPQPGLAAAPARGRPRDPRLRPRPRPGAGGAGPDRRGADRRGGGRPHPRRGWWSGTWPCSTPSPGPASPACPGCWRSARSRWPPAGGGAGWPAPCSASPSSPTRSRTCILIASGLAWHWDLDQSGLSAVAYRRVLGRVFEAAGFETLRTDEPEIAYHPANLFVARIGSRVPPARRAAFTSRLVRGHHAMP